MRKKRQGTLSYIPSNVFHGGSVTLPKTHWGATYRLNWFRITHNSKQWQALVSLSTSYGYPRFGIVKIVGKVMASISAAMGDVPLSQNATTVSDWLFLKSSLGGAKISVEV